LDEERDAVVEVVRPEVGVGFSQLDINNFSAQPFHVDHVEKRKPPV